MRELFTIDKKNYKEGGSVGRRPSVRGIIIRGGRILMMHSLKYGYCKLPGGGVEPGETHEQTLLREVREESGHVVIPESVREYGCVRRIEKGMVDDIFIQENFYYLCDAEEQTVETEQDDYEREERFTPEYLTVSEALELNRTHSHGEKDGVPTFEGMLEREARVLEMLAEQIGGLL